MIGKLDKPSINSLLAALSNSGQQILILPIAASCYNQVEISIWLLLGTIFSVGLLIESGMNYTLCRAAAYSAERSVHNNNQGISLASINKASKFLYALFSGFFLIVLFIAQPYIFGTLSTHPSSTQEMELGYYLLAICLLINFNNQRLSALIMGSGELPKLKRTQARFAIARVFFALLLTPFFDLSVTYFLVQLVFLIVELVAILNIWNSIIRRYNPKSLPLIQAIKDIAPFLIPMTKSTFIRVGGALIYYSSAFVITHSQDPHTIATYLTTLRVLTLLNNFCTIPMQISLPELARAHNLGEQSIWKDISIRTISFCMTCHIIGIISVYLLSSLVSTIALQQSLLLAAYYFFPLALVYALELHHVLHSYVYETSNDVPFLFLSLASGLAILVASYTLLPYYGVAGLILAQGLIQLAGNNWYPVYKSLGLLRISFAGYLSHLKSALTTTNFSDQLNLLGTEQISRMREFEKQ